MRSSFVQRLRNQKHQTVPTRQSQEKSAQHSTNLRPTSLKNPKKEVNQHCIDLKNLLSILEEIKNPQFQDNVPKHSQNMKTHTKIKIYEDAKSKQGKKQNFIKPIRIVSKQFQKDITNLIKTQSDHCNRTDENLFANLQRKDRQYQGLNLSPSNDVNSNLYKIGQYKFPVKSKMSQLLILPLIKLKEKHETEQLQKPDKSLFKVQNSFNNKIQQKPCVNNVIQRTQNKRGLQNIGNTCYINSVIQCLFHLPSFNDYFSNEKYSEDSNLMSQKFNSDRSIVQKYRQLYLYVMRGQTEKNESKKSTYSLKLALSKSCSLFLDWQQQDAHEFMRKMLDSMHQQINRIQTPTAYKLLKTRTKLKYSSISTLADQYFQYYKQRDDSYMYDSFGGQIYNNIKCINCQNQSISFENCLDISLPIVKGKNDLGQLLKEFFGEERLCDFYKCEYCGETNKHSTKSTKFWRTPEILIIHLKRSQFGKKNQDPITFPMDYLSLKSHINNQSDKSHKYANYTLKSVVCHRGVVEGGHYWSVMKEFGQWYEANDQKVTKLSQEELKRQFEVQGSPEAYILFYESMNR